jgi:hypothetical protein
VAGRIRSIEESNDLTGNRTCDLAACSTVPQSTALLHAPLGCVLLCIIEACFMYVCFLCFVCLLALAKDMDRGEKIEIT